MRLLSLLAICAALVVLSLLAPPLRPLAARAAPLILTPMMYLPVVLPGLFVIPEPSAQYRVTLLRQLTACENNGNHNLYVLVLDGEGNGIPNIPVQPSTSRFSITATTGRLVENIPVLGVNPKTTAGFVDIPLYHHRVRSQVAGGSSEQTPWLPEDLPDEACEENGNPIGNSVFHYSYLVIFTKQW